MNRFSKCYTSLPTDTESCGKIKKRNNFDKNEQIFCCLPHWTVAHFISIMHSCIYSVTRLALGVNIFAILTPNLLWWHSYVPLGFQSILFLFNKIHEMTSAILKRGKCINYCCSTFLLQKIYLWHLFNFSTICNHRGGIIHVLYSILHLAI